MGVAFVWKSWLDVGITIASLKEWERLMQRNDFQILIVSINAFWIVHFEQNKNKNKK